ncbi:MAG: OprO/OprP family phosphate-selective porin [Pseudomonadota bacterium]
MKHRVMTTCWIATALAVTVATPALGKETPPFTFKLGGQVMYDAAWYQGDGALKTQTEGYTHDTGFRRVRLSARGSVYGDWNYNVTLSFADTLNNISDADPAGIRQAFVSYSGWKGIKVKAGQFIEPFGLESSTSSRITTFMERGLPYAFSPGRSLGASVSTAPVKGLYMEAGIFKEDLHSAGNLDQAFTGRIAYAPIDTKGWLVHLGAGASHRLPGDGTVRYRTPPEADMAPNWFSSGTIRNVDDILLTGLEAATVIGPFSLQGEYMRSRVDRNNGRPERNLDGYYVYASWFLTGESRPYRDGRFTAIDPQGRWGAWELAARNSAIDDGNGHRLNDITLGLNWYINQHLRLMANYVRAVYDRVSAQGNADIFQVRGQVDF